MESGVAYMNYGFALIEALIIAKIIPIGRVFGWGKRFERKPLILSVLYKSVLFGVHRLGCHRRILRRSRGDRPGARSSRVVGSSGGARTRTWPRATANARRPAWSSAQRWSRSGCCNRPSKGRTTFPANRLPPCRGPLLRAI